MLKQKEKISIVIPVFNMSQYVRRCLDSVLNQTYENLEIICVDDGSTDGSGIILDDYAAKDSRVYVIHNEKAGVVKARNSALDHLSGDFVGFVDADDYVKKDYIEKLKTGFVDEDVDMVTCGFSYAYDDRVEIIENKDVVPENPVDAKTFIKYMYERDVYRGVSGYLWTRLIRSSLLEKGTKLRFNIKYETTDDILFVANLVCRSNKVRYINDPLYYYYQREGSIVHNDERNLKTLVWLRTWVEVLKLYSEKGVDPDNINLVKRMLVYRGGKLLEIARENNDNNSKKQIVSIITPYIDIYIKTNIDYPERIKWINDLM